ncbi:hypothetical protein ACH50O_05700 [Methylomonas sp. 2BW1-5-20]|uniref:hypothetical protein n=1 Tax=Methylomonas sp. 2BW1-5-20 TaxID=3376686 RepID=UPI004050212E
MNTENQDRDTNNPSNADDLIELFDTVMLQTERARCVLELVSSALESSDLLPAIRVAIDELATIDHSIQTWNNNQTINA